MAFTHTIGRYASFGTVQVIPSNIIDLFWNIIDQNLKGVFELDPTIRFELLNHDGKLSIRFTQESSKEVQLEVDVNYDFNSDWPRRFYAVDNLGRETIVTEKEL